MLHLGFERAPPIATLPVVLLGHGRTMKSAVLKSVECLPVFLAILGELNIERYDDPSHPFSLALAN